MTAPDLQAMRAHALAAAKRGSRWAYRQNYATGVQTISVHEPDDHTVHLTRIFSWDYAHQAGCSGRQALAQLRKLVEAGFLTEQRGAACRFALSREDAVAIGREIIAELQADGLPFDDEWRARKSA